MSKKINNIKNDKEEEENQQQEEEDVNQNKTLKLKLKKLYMLRTKELMEQNKKTINIAIIASVILVLIVAIIIYIVLKKKYNDTIKAYSTSSIINNKEVSDKLVGGTADLEVCKKIKESCKSDCINKIIEANKSAAIPLTDDSNDPNRY